MISQLSYGTCADGEMTEWPIVHPWKGCVGETPPRVRIPLSPPLTESMQGVLARDEMFRRSEAERANGMSNPSLSAI